MTFADNLEAPENEFLQIILNAREFAATGIKKGAFDEDIYKHMVCSMVIKDWDLLESYIIELRGNAGRIVQR